MIEPFRTFDVHEEVKADGWHRIITALTKHGQGLSLPPSVMSFPDVVPANLRHKLWLQFCFDALSGLGQSDDINLEEQGSFRIDDFVGRLRGCKQSVAHFRLTMETLLTRIILPERDRPLFLKLMEKKLGLGCAQEPISNRL